jgi:hypothetical protein
MQCLRTITLANLHCTPVVVEKNTMVDDSD